MDHFANRFESKVSFLPVDLSSLSSHRLLDDLVHQVRPLWIHFGIPCGTASRARQLPLSAKARARGVPQPRPLRSAKFPLGLPDLSPSETARVESANAVYRTCVRALFAAWKAHSLVTIENPSRAWTWAALAALVCQFARDNSCPRFEDWYFELQDVHFSMCMHGGHRKKETRLRCTPQVFQALALDCDGGHSHAPYGHRMHMGTWVFDTSQEAQYPRLFCDRLVRAASAAVQPALFKDTIRHFRLDSLAASGRQTTRHAPLIPEFSEVVWASHPPSVEAKPLPLLSRQDCSRVVLRDRSPAWPVPVPVDLPSLGPPLHDAAAEKLAWTLLQQEAVDQPDVLRLVNLLTASKNSRRAEVAEGLAWTCGTYVFSSEVGLHQVTRTCPAVCQLLACVMRHFAPGVAYTSLAVFADFLSPEHTDAHNDHSFYNVIVPLSSFSGGGVRVRDVTLPVADGPCYLQTCYPHRVLPAQGRRVVLVAFNVRSWAALHPGDVAFLRGLCFPWPSDCPLPSNKAGEGEVGGRLYESGSGVAQAWGVHHTMQQHVHLAERLQHPAEAASVVPDCVRRALFDLATQGPELVAKKRDAALSDIEARARNIGVDNNHPITQNKCLKLFRELVEETGFPDLEVCKFMEQGVSLVGVEPSSPIFQARPKPLRSTPEQLDSQAVWRRRELLSKPPQKLSEEELSILNDETEEECKLGFLEGPFATEDEVTARLGSDQWSPSQRFLLLQGEDRKPRVIDNLRDSGINAAFGSTSLLQLHDIDFVTAMAMFIARVWENKDHVRVPLASGDLLEGEWHPGSRSAAWVGRCLDLSKAYKQVPVCDSSLKYAVIAMPSRSSEWVFYLARGLPFGGSGSVFSFNKISRALWHIAVVKLGLITSVYVDDYPTFEIEPLGQSASDSFSRLLSTLGWVHATTGKKAVGFAAKWVALGAQFDFTHLHEGTLVVSNKEGRVDRIKSLARQLTEADANVKQIATSLHGLLNFASGFVLGSALKPIAREYSQMAVRPATYDNEAIIRLNGMLCAVLSAMRPRIFTVTDPREPLLIYTDGSLEGDRALWGVFIIDLETQEKLTLSGSIPERIQKYWNLVVGDQTICEIELFAFLCAKWAYGKKMSSRKGFVFVDNNSALATLIKRTSHSDAMFRVVAVINAMDAVFPFGAWYDRVPSKSNPADLPSRGESVKLCSMFGASDQGGINFPDELVTFITDPCFSFAALEILMEVYAQHHKERGKVCDAFRCG